MKKIYILLLFIGSFSLLKAQTGYDIKINFKGCQDTTLYLARYFFDQLPILDSCKKIKNGKIQFKGNMALDKGVYFIANQSRNSFYFQFIVDANQKFTINIDAANIAASLKCLDDKQNDQFFSYVRYMTEKGTEFSNSAALTKGKSKKDSAAFMLEKQKNMNADIVKFDADFMTRNKGSFVHDLMNLKNEKYPNSIPLAKNRADSANYQYYYYKNHFFDGVDFKDNRIISTPFFADRIKKYFDQLVPQHPDSVIKELDRILDQCVPGSTVYNSLVGYFTYKFETNKAMSFDQYGKSQTFEKVFVHLAYKCIVSGNTNGYYSDETVAKIKERVDILKNLLPDSKVSELYMIDTIRGRDVLKMGFDTARSSAGATYLYNKNADKLAPMFKTLSEIKAKYTILIFWAADCGHCQTEVPKLHEDLKALKGKVDYKVFAVQTKEELFDSWKKFITEKKLTDFTHVFDPVHINNIKVTFDIQGTPVIYLLDKDKKIKAKKLSSEQVVEILNKLEEIDKNLNKQ